VHDVVLGRSEASLEGYLAQLEGKHLVQLVCLDLAPSYRALVRKHFPQARIVADRFHVIRTVSGSTFLAGSLPNNANDYEKMTGNALLRQKSAVF
jgi:transposase